MRPHRPVALIVLAGIALVANACTIGDDRGEPTVVTTPVTTAPAEDGDNVLTIGLLVPTTGDGAAIGSSIRDAVEVEVDAINAAGGVNDEQVRYRVADEGTEDGLASLLEPGAVNDPVDAIVGPTSSRVALRDLGQTVKPPNQVVTCSPSATALSLDNFDDKGYFFRTITSDSLLMSAMVKRAQSKGRPNIAVAYLDDPYGRGLVNALQREIDAGGRLTLTGEPVAIPPDREDLAADAAGLIAQDPGVIIVLADSSVGGRFLLALSDQMPQDSNPVVLVNDSVRTAREAIAGISPSMRDDLFAVVPRTTVKTEDATYGPFAAQAVDCVDLIALAAVQAESDARRDIRRQFAAVSLGGQTCRTFATCAELIRQGRVIDYDGRSGPVDLGETGEPNRGYFEEISFQPTGFEDPVRQRFEAS